MKRFLLVGFLSTVLSLAARADDLQRGVFNLYRPVVEVAPAPRKVETKTVAAPKPFSYDEACSLAASRNAAGVVVCKGVSPEAAEARKADAERSGFVFCEAAADDLRFVSGTTTFTFVERGKPGLATVGYADLPVRAVPQPVEVQSPPPLLSFQRLLQFNRPMMGGQCVGQT